MKLNEILTEEVLKELSLRRGLAAGALAASLAAAPHAAKADTFLTQHNPNNTQTTMHIGNANSAEYNQKMYPVYQQMLKDYLATNPGMDLSFARDIVRGRWTAKYHSAPPVQVSDQSQQSFKSAMGY